MGNSRLIPGTWEVPQEFHDRLGERPGRQRVMLAAGHLLFVLHEPPGPDESVRRPRLFWREPNGTWHNTGKSHGVAAFKGHLEEFERAIDRFDQLEDRAARSRDFLTILEATGPLKRSIANLHQVLEEARRMIPADRDLINLRDQAYDLSRTAELLYDATRNALDTARTRQAEEQAASSSAMAIAAHRLNLMVAVFFPLATLAAIFGMELPNGLDSVPAPWAFLGVCGVGLVLGLLVATLFIGRRTVSTGSAAGNGNPPASNG